MNREINLIANRKDNAVSKERVVRLTKIAAGISLGLVALLTIILFFLNRDVSFAQLSDKEKTTLTGLSLANKKIAKLLLAKNRLTDIQLLLKKRSTYEDILTQIDSNVPNNIKMESLTITRESIVITLSSNSLSSVNSFLSFMTDILNQKKTFQSININGVTNDIKSGKYTLSLEAKFL